MQLLKDCLLVGMGGFVGAILRFLITLIPVKFNFPLMTFVVNITGAILIGFIVGVAMAFPNINSSTVLFLKTGLCGGYTTLSAMVLESTDLFRSGHSVTSIVYLVLTVVFCVLGVLLGQFLATLVFKNVA